MTKYTHYLAVINKPKTHLSVQGYHHGSVGERIADALRLPYTAPSTQLHGESAAGGTPEQWNRCLESAGFVRASGCDWWEHESGMWFQHLAGDQPAVA